MRVQKIHSNCNLSSTTVKDTWDIKKQHLHLYSQIYSHFQINYPFSVFPKRNLWLVKFGVPRSSKRKKKLLIKWLRNRLIFKAKKRWIVFFIINANTIISYKWNSYVHLIFHETSMGTIWKIAQTRHIIDTTH